MTGNLHVVENFVAYNNGSSQIAHGAYRNCYIYKNIQVFGTKNQNYGLTHHNQTNDDCVRRADGYRFRGLFRGCPSGDPEPPSAARGRPGAVPPLPVHGDYLE